MRGIAVLLVVLFHIGIPVFLGGFVGVDVFFVISGFVITGLLLREREVEGHVTFAHFYARRVRRLLPAAVLVIVASLAATRFLVGRHAAILDASDSRWSVAFLANFHFARVTPNILVNRPSPIGQYWSLAVEEQFYLLYPAFFALLLWLGTRSVPRLRLAIGLTLVFLGSLCYSIVVSAPGLTAPYVSLGARAWQLALASIHRILT